MEQKLEFRGVPFAVKIEGRGYRWVIHPASLGPAGAASGQTSGPSAFRHAVTEAHQAIDTWLARHPADEASAEQELASG